MPNPCRTLPNLSGTVSNPCGTVPNPCGTVPNPDSAVPNPELNYSAVCTFLQYVLYCILFSPVVCTPLQSVLN